MCIYITIMIKKEVINLRKSKRGTLEELEEELVRKGM